MWASIIGFLVKGAGFVMDLITQRKAAEHDADVRGQQQTTDALQGESDALKQVDRTNAAVDNAGSVPISDDPNNRNR